MFVRPCWKPRTEEEMFRLVDENEWALLVSNGDEGPLATNLPLLLDRSRGPHGTLVGHIARGNAHAEALLSSKAPTLAVFEGPYSYVTASWYPKRDMPSTYYYTAVHCYGRVRPQADAELEAWLRRLNDRMEARFPDGWKLEEVPHADITRRLPFIMGFDIEIERIEGKFKLGQDEPRKDAMAVSQRLAGSPEEGKRALARAISDYNLERPEA